MRSLPPPAGAGFPPAVESPETQGSPGALSIQGLWKTFVRSWWIVAILVGGSLAISAFRTAREPLIYESSATLLFPEESSPLQLASQLNPLARSSSGGIATHLMVLQSRRIAEIVVNDLGLQFALTDPEMRRSAIVEDAQRSGIPQEGRYVLIPEGDGYTIRKDLSGEVVDRGRFGAPSEVLGLTLTLRRPPPELERIPFQILSERTAADVLRGGIIYSQPNAGAQVLRVNYRSVDPQLAADVPNAISAAFIAYQRGIDQGQSGSMVSFLADQVASYEQQLRDAEEALRAFRENGQIVNLEDEASAQVSRLAELQADRSRLLTERQALSSLLSEAQSGNGDGEFRRLASFPTFLSNSAVQDLLSTLSDLENERSSLLVRRTRDNIDVQGITARIAALEDELYQLARGYLAGIDNQLSAVNQSLSAFQSDLERIPEREVQYVRLVRQQESVEELYLLLQRRLKETEIQEAVQSENVRLLDPALVPGGPVGPNLRSSLLFAFLVGFCGSVAIIMLRYAVDSRIRSAEELRATTGTPLLGIVPSMGTPKALLAGRVLRRLRDPRSRLDNVAPSDSPPRVGPAAAEAFRSLRTVITQSLYGDHPVLLITSPLAGEGKTTTSANLALAMAQQGLRVLLIDGDLRSRGIHERFGLRQSPGLAEVLCGERDAESAEQGVHLVGSPESLTVLTAGSASEQAIEYLVSARMDTLLRSVRERFDFVLIDSPALIPVADALGLSQYVDGALIVARAGVTDRGDLERAGAELQRVGAPVFGVILNDVPADQTPYGRAATYGASLQTAGASNA